MDALVECVIVAVLALALCAVAYRKRFMTLAATAAAFIFACVTGFCGGLFWEITLMLFPAAAFVATKMGFEEKKKAGLQEGDHGERGLLNILGVTMVPTIICLVHFLTDTADFELTVAYVSAIAVSTADTLASELGTRDPKVYMITTGKPCERGMNGGVSRFGLLVSFIGAMVIGLVGMLLITRDVSVWLIIPGIAGMLGNLIDSVEGALFENKGYMSKYSVNATSALIGAIIGFLFALFA